MNGNAILHIGFKGPLIGLAKAAGTSLQRSGQSETQALTKLSDVFARPNNYISDDIFGSLATALIDERIVIDIEDPASLPLRPLKIFGEDIIDEASVKQMRESLQIPVSISGALMPDSHVGYSCPIGGVISLKNAVVPAYVGVDISCRMEMSITDIEPRKFEQKQDRFISALSKGTVFGTGKVWDPKMYHPVMDQDWNVTKVTKRMKDTAAGQLGTSGTGNHFVEWGIVNFNRIPDTLIGAEQIEPNRDYIALMSHSGSRGPGSNVCKEYSAIAASKLPKKYAKYAHLAWLDLDSEAGQEYWAAMTLMRDFARANHECIHHEVCSLVGAQALGVVKNEHNLAWKEMHDGQEVVVHRKGATPAGLGVMGIIPGSMGDAAYVVVGKGAPLSLNSASHGAGRKYSRTKAKEAFNWAHWKGELKRRGVHLIAAGLDEVPGAYKNIEDVMARQTELVESVGKFTPRIVRMADDGTSED